MSFPAVSRQIVPGCCSVEPGKTKMKKEKIMNNKQIHRSESDNHPWMTRRRSSWVGVFSTLLLLLIGCGTTFAQNQRFVVRFEIARPFSNKPTENIFVIRLFNARGGVVEQNVGERVPGNYEVGMAGGGLGGEAPTRVEIGTAWGDQSFAIGNFQVFVYNGDQAAAALISPRGKKLSARGPNNLGSLPLQSMTNRDLMLENHVVDVKEGDKIFLQSERGYFLTMAMDPAITNKVLSKVANGAIGLSENPFPPEVDLPDDTYAMLGKPEAFAANPVTIFNAPERYQWVVRNYSYDAGTGQSTLKLQPYWNESAFLDADNDNSVMVSETESEVVWIVKGNLQGLSLAGYCLLFGTDLDQTTLFSRTSEEDAFKIPGKAKKSFITQSYSGFNMVDRGDTGEDKYPVLRRTSDNPQRWGIIVDMRHRR